MSKYLVSFFIFILQFSYAVGVPAGTEIKNIAYIEYEVKSIPMKSKSNELIDIVDQKLDMNIVCEESNSIVVEANDKKRVMRFMLTNNGNGEDTYTLTNIEASEVDFSVLNTKIYIDNGDGIFSLADDKLVTEQKLLADEYVLLFLVSDIPPTANKLSSNGIQADSITQGNLLYGEVKELDNFYAVVANTKEAQSAYCTYEVPSIELELEKTATLSSDKLYKGTTIHYAINIKAIGIGTLENIVITDNIPEGTGFVSGSLKLDAVDAGSFNGESISVAIDSISQEVESNEVLHRVTFDVKVK